MQPYRFEENININLKNFESGKSDGRIKRYGQPKFIQSRIGIEKGETIIFELELKDHLSDRTDLKRMSIQS